MTVFDSGFKIGKSIAVDTGIMILAAIVVPALANALKPIAKAAIKGGITGYLIIKASAAGTVDILKDITAEAKSELDDASK
jgi:Protein of unknown function (DUF5132)